MALRLKDRLDKRREEARLCLDRKADFESRCGFGSYTRGLAKWDVQWRMVMERQSRPWPHASDYNPPVTFSKVEDVHAVLYGFVSGFDFFSVAAAAKKGNADEIMRKRAQDWTDLLRWSLQNESNSSAFLDRFTHDGCLYGSGFGGLNWLRAIRKIRSASLAGTIRHARDASDAHIVERECLGIAAVHSLRRIDGVVPSQIKKRVTRDDGSQRGRWDVDHLAGRGIEPEVVRIRRKSAQKVVAGAGPVHAVS